MNKINFLNMYFLLDTLLPNENGQQILKFVGIILAVIVAIILVIFTFKNVFVSRVLSLIFTIASFIMMYGYYGDNDDVFLVIATIANTFAIMYYAGPVCFEDTRETEVYLVLGSLVEETVGESPIKTFFSTLFVSIILSIIFIFLVSNLGIIIMCVLYVIFAILIIVSFIRAIIDIF